MDLPAASKCDDVASKDDDELRRVGAKMEGGAKESILKALTRYGENLRVGLSGRR